MFVRGDVPPASGLALCLQPARGFFIKSIPAADRVYTLRTNPWSPVGNSKLLFLFGSLRAVFGTGLTPVGDTCGIQGTSDDVVSGTGQILHPAAADQDDAMLLKVVAFAGNIARNLDAVGKTYSGDLPQSRIRLLGGSSLDSCADATLLR